jgi:hypothetical protein
MVQVITVESGSDQKLCKFGSGFKTSLNLGPETVSKVKTVFHKKRIHIATVNLNTA